MHFSYCSRYLITEVRDFHILEFGGKEGFLAVSCHSFIPPTFMEYLFAAGLCERERERERDRERERQRDRERENEREKIKQ